MRAIVETTTPVRRSAIRFLTAAALAAGLGTGLATSVSADDDDGYDDDGYLTPGGYWYDAGYWHGNAYYYYYYYYYYGDVDGYDHDDWGDD